MSLKGLVCTVSLVMCAIPATAQDGPLQGRGNNGAVAAGGTL